MIYCAGDGALFTGLKTSNSADLATQAAKPPNINTTLHARTPPVPLLSNSGLCKPIFVVLSLGGKSGARRIGCVCGGERGEDSIA